MARRTAAAIRPNTSAAPITLAPEAPKSGHALSGQATARMPDATASPRDPRAARLGPSAAETSRVSASSAGGSGVADASGTTAEEKSSAENSSQMAAAISAAARRFAKRARISASSAGMGHPNSTAQVARARPRA